MHLQDWISDNLSGTIAKQEMTSCPRERYTRGLHCHIIFVMQHQALYITSRIITQHCKHKRFFQVALNRIGILWEVLDRFGWFCCWFWVVLGGSMF